MNILKTGALFSVLLLSNPTLPSANNSHIKFSILTLEDSLDKNPVVLNPQTHKFEYIIREGSKRWRKMQDDTYSNYGNDKGHINSKGQKTGTNRSVASKTAEKYLKKVVTADDMKALTFEDAKIIYEDIWKTNMLGDKMKCHNPILLDLIFNSICSRPARAYSDFSETIAEISGIRLAKNKITLSHIEEFNCICENYEQEEQFYLIYLSKRMNFCHNAAKKSQQRGLQKWGKDYPTTIYQNEKEILN